MVLANDRIAGRGDRQSIVAADDVCRRHHMVTAHGNAYVGVVTADGYGITPWKPFHIEIPLIQQTQRQRPVWNVMRLGSVIGRRSFGGTTLDRTPDGLPETLPETRAK